MSDYGVDPNETDRNGIFMLKAEAERERNISKNNLII